MLTREAVAAEGVEGGFSAVYPVLRALEEAGRIRRGYFVDGLGAAQFALAGAVDRLRAVRDARDGRTASRPPARRRRPGQPVRRRAGLAAARRGATAGPCQRAAGAYVVLVDGVAALYLERGGSTLQTLPPADDPAVAAAARGRWATSSPTAGSASSSSEGRRRAGRRVPRRPCSSSAGFVAAYRGLTLRSTR